MITKNKTEWFMELIVRDLRTQGGSEVWRDVELWSSGGLLEESLSYSLWRLRVCVCVCVHARAHAHVCTPIWGSSKYLNQDQKFSAKSISSCDYAKTIITSLFTVWCDWQPHLNIVNNAKCLCWGFQCTIFPTVSMNEYKVFSMPTISKNEFDSRFLSPTCIIKMLQRNITFLLKKKKLFRSPEDYLWILLGNLNSVLVQWQRSMKNIKCYLLIHSISSVYMSTPISQFILLPIFPCGVHMFVLYICVPISALWEIGIVDLIFLPSLFEEKLLIIKECITLYSSYISGASQVVLVVKNPPAIAGDARDMDSIPGSGRSLQVGNGTTPQYSCLGNPTDRKPGGLQSTGSQRIGHDWTVEHTHTSCISLLYCFAGYPTLKWKAVWMQKLFSSN